MRIRLSISVLAVAMLVAVFAPAAEAEVVDSYCAGTGGRSGPPDEQGIKYCLEIVDKGGQIRLKIAAIFTGAYSICVDPPRGRRDCDGFNLEGDGEIHLDSVSLVSHFPSRASGRYAVTWSRDGHKLAPVPLHFNRR